MARDDDSSALGETEKVTPQRMARQGFSSRWLAVGLGGLLALVTVAAILSVFTGRRLPTIDQARFDAAQALWNEHGPTSYDLEVAVTEIEPAVYQVSVRDGDVTSATRNGTPMTQRRTLGVWSVPGMFTTISIDLRHATDPIQVGANQVNYVTPQGEFDPQFGYPVRYRRIQWGSDNEASWVVTKFSVVK